MAFVFVSTYSEELVRLNKGLYVVYVDAYSRIGGERRIVYLRQHEKGLPLTLRENFSEDGHLSSETEARDIMTLRREISDICDIKNVGANICVPILPISNELNNIERRSPKLHEYLIARMNRVGLVVQ